MRFRFLLLVVIDQITKTVFADRDFFVGTAHVKLMKNFGLPFGLNFSTPWNEMILLVAYLVVGWYAVRYSAVSKLGQWGKILFLSGAASNLADRLVFGFVRDFLDLQLGFVFNLADVFIVAGIICLLLDGRVAKTADKSSIDYPA